MRRLFVFHSPMMAVFFFCISLLFKVQPQLDLICSLAGRDDHVTNISGVKEG